MVARPVDEDLTVAMEINNPKLEIVHFTAQSINGDWYDCKKINFVQGAFASNLTSDDKEIQVSWAVQANGQSRITIIPEEASTEGYLVIIGKK